MDPVTESEWLGDSTRMLTIIQDHASTRKMRLAAAAYVRHLQDLPGHEDAKRCDDLLESCAENPRPVSESVNTLYGRPGTWWFTHLLAPEDPTRLAMAFRKLIAFTDPCPANLHAELLREVIGNPFRPIAFDPAWRTSTVIALARGVYDDKAFDRMPILADALQDAGCENADILDHCRGDSLHIRGCWVVDLVLGKE